MESRMVVVRHADQYFGPFRPEEAAVFAATLTGPSDVLPLTAPPVPGEATGPLTLRPLDAATFASLRDDVKIDTGPVLANVLQGFYFARRDSRVLTAHELLDLWKSLFAISQAVASLMHHADAAIYDPSAAPMEALRKAVWRNRDADDVDPHYRDRFW